MTTTRSIPTALRWRHAATLCAATIVVGSAVAIAPAGFAAETPTPAPSASTPAPTPTTDVGTVVAAPRAGGIFLPTTDLVVDVRLTAPSATPGTATLKVGAAALADEAAITSWLAGESTITTLADVGTAAVTPQAGEATDVELRGSRIVSTLTGLAPGVYPIQVSYVSGTTTITDNAVITVPDAGSDVSVVVPFTAPPTSSGLLTATTLAGLTADDGALTVALRAAQSANVIVAVDPAVIAAMRVLGTSAPASVQAWLADFAELDNDMFVLPFADADVATLAAAGHPDLAPTSLVRYLDSSFTEPSNAATPNPTTSPTAVPTLDELLMVPGALDDLVWPAAGGLTQATIDWAAGDAKTVLVSSEQVDASQAHVTLDTTGVDALVYDAELSAALSIAVAEEDAVTRNDELSAVLARAQMATDTRVLIALDRALAWNEPATLETLDALSSASSGRLAGEVLLRAQTPVGAAVTVAPEPTERAAVLTSLLENETPLADMAVVLADPALITGAERAEILQLFSTSWIGEATWDAAIAAHRTAVDDTLNAIEISPLSTIQFLTSGSSIPLQVRNDLPFSATLKLWAQPDDFRLTVESPTTVEAQAGAVTKVLIPVTAGLGNGDVTIRFWLTADNGEPIGQPMFTDVLVRAEWEKIGIIISIAVVLFLIGGGIFRTVNKRRKAREKARLEASGDAALGVEASDVEAAGDEASGDEDIKDSNG